MGKLDVPPTQGPSHIRCELKRRIGQELRAETPGERQCKDVKQYSKRPSNRQTQDRSSPSGRAKTANLHERGSNTRKIPGSSPSRRAHIQANCTTQAPTTTRSQGRARAAASSDPKLWMTAAGFDPGPSRRRARWQTAAPEPPGDFPGGPERGSAALYVGLYESAQNHRQRLRVDLAKLENFDRCEIRAPPEFWFLTAGGLLNQREEPLIVQK